MRLSDLVADLQGELQKGVDLAEGEHEAEQSRSRFSVRSVEVDLPVSVSEAENGDHRSEADELRGQLDVRPGEGNGRLTFSFVPGGRQSGDEAAPTEQRPSFTGGVDTGERLDEDTAGEDPAGTTPIIPDALEDQPPIVFDPSVPTDLSDGADRPVEAVEGIGPKRAEALEGIDVTTVAELAAADPAAVAEELATAETQAERLVARARFMDLGADEQTAEILVDRGVTLEQIAGTDPDTLLEQLSEATVTGETPVPEDYEPSPESVTRLVELATKRRR